MTSQPPAPRRNAALVTIDIAAGILLLLVGVAVALSVLTTALAYGGLHAECGAGPRDGITCNSLVLSIVVYGLIAVSVLALFFGFGMFVVSAIRRRWAFYWPLTGLVLTLVLFYLGTWVASLTLP